MARLVSSMLTTTPPLSPLQGTEEPDRIFIFSESASCSARTQVTRPDPMSRPAIIDFAIVDSGD